MRSTRFQFCIWFFLFSISFQVAQAEPVSAGGGPDPSKGGTISPMVWKTPVLGVGEIAKKCKEWPTLYTRQMCQVYYHLEIANSTDARLSNHDESIRTLEGRLEGYRETQRTQSGTLKEVKASMSEHAVQLNLLRALNEEQRQQIEVQQDALNELLSWQLVMTSEFNYHRRGPVYRLTHEHDCQMEDD